MVTDCPMSVLSYILARIKRAPLASGYARLRKMASQPFADGADCNFATDISCRMRVPESIKVTGEAASPVPSSFISPDLATNGPVGDSSVMEASFQSMIAERTKMSVPEHITFDKTTTPTQGPRTSSRAGDWDDPFDFYSPSVTADRKTPAASTQPNSRATVHIPEETETGLGTVTEEDEEDDCPFGVSMDLEVDEGDLDGSVVQRLVSLEREVVSLRRRVAQLETGMTVGNSAILATLFVFWLVNPIVFHIWYK